MMNNAEKKMVDKKLIKYIIDEVQGKGVVGEEDSIIVLTMKIMLRLVKNAEATSSNILVSDKTGGGKDFLTMRVCKVLCEQDKTFFHRTTISPKVLNYWQPTIDKEPVSWDGRVLYLEDPEEDAIKSQAFKVMTSGGTSMTVIKDQKVLDKKIDGKPVIIVTSMKTQIDVEGQRRWDAVRIDTSQQLSDKVINASLANAAGLIVRKDDDTFCKCLQALRSFNVKIPWAMKLQASMQNPDMIARTQINKLLDYIKASAVMHQWDREKEGSDTIVATEEDYELARFVYIHLRNKEGNALCKQEEVLLDYLRGHEKPIKLNQVITDLEGVSKSWLYEHKDDMIEKEVVSSVTLYDSNANREIEHLQIPTTKKVVRQNLPSAKKLLQLNGYLSGGVLYQEINKIRKEQGLLPLFKELKE